MADGIGGIISGFDTQSIIDATLSIYQGQIDDMEVEKVEYQVDQEAYNTVNTLLLEFSNQVETLADEDLWNSYVSASSNENSLNATINKYAQEGTYQFEVKQLAQTAQFTSVGFSENDTAVSPLEEGIITLDSAKASLAQSTDTSVLNNGVGVSAGVIEITDSKGSVAKIDLSSAITVDDILEGINNCTDISVTVSVSDDGDGLLIEDCAGGSGALIIKDVDSTTAEDLGILGVSDSGIIDGDCIYGLGDNTVLDQLNDGLGVNDGVAGTIVISDGTDTWEVDLAKCNNLGQVAMFIGEETEGAVTIDYSDDGLSLVAGLISGSGSLSISDYSGSDTTASDLGLVTSAGGGSYKGSKIFAGINTFQLSSISGADGSGLDGLAGSYNSGEVSFTAEFDDASSIDFNLSGLAEDDTLNSLITELNTQAGGTLTFSLNAASNGLEVKNAAGSSVEFIDQSSTLATDLGFTGFEVAGGESMDCADLDLKYISSATSLDSLNNGSGVEAGSFILTDANGFSDEIDIEGADTIGEVVERINAATLDVEARVNDTGDGIIIESTDLSATGTISAQEVSGGSSAADLGLARDSTVDSSGNAILNGSFEVTVSVSDSDSLTDVMDKINEQTSYTASIINDGTTYSPYRLAIASEDSGQASNFIMDSSIDSLSFSQTTMGQDSLLLYGDSNTGSEPVLLRSDTNTNNSAIIGITLDMAAVTDDPVSITVSRDSEGISDTIQAMVDSYNEVVSTIQTLTTYLTPEEIAYNEENSITTSTGLLYGDSSTKNIELELQSYFSYVAEDNSSLRTFTDLGISFDLEEVEDDDGNVSYSTLLAFDAEDFEELLDSDFDEVAEFFYDKSDVALASKGASISIAGSPADGFSSSNLINGKTSSEDFGENNGYQAGDTISSGDNRITVSYDEPVLLDYLTIYHIDSEEMPADEYALSDFTVEYLDSSTNEWVTLREVDGNTSSYTVIGTSEPVSASAIRINAEATNADDDIMRLVEIDCIAESGAASSLNANMQSIFDYEYGYLASRTDYVDAITEELDGSIESMTELMEAKEAVLWAQYNAMEQTLASLESESSYVNATISGTSSDS